MGPSVYIYLARRNQKQPRQRSYITSIASSFYQDKKIICPRQNHFCPWMVPWVYNQFLGPTKFWWFPPELSVPWPYSIAHINFYKFFNTSVTLVALRGLTFKFSTRIKTIAKDWGSTFIKMSVILGLFIISFATLSKCGIIKGKIFQKICMHMIGISSYGKFGLGCCSSNSVKNALYSRMHRLYQKIIKLLKVFHLCVKNDFKKMKI